MKILLRCIRLSQASEPGSRKVLHRLNTAERVQLILSPYQSHFDTTQCHSGKVGVNLATPSMAVGYQPSAVSIGKFFPNKVFSYSLIAYRSLPHIDWETAPLDSPTAQN